MTCKLAGTLPLAFHATSSGTSRLQCGHQCATNTSITGPFDQSMVTGDPSNA